MYISLVMRVRVGVYWRVWRARRVLCVCVACRVRSPLARVDRVRSSQLPLQRAPRVDCGDRRSGAGVSAVCARAPPLVPAGAAARVSACLSVSVRPSVRTSVVVRRLWSVSIRCPSCPSPFPLNLTSQKSQHHQSVPSGKSVISSFGTKCK